MNEVKVLIDWHIILQLGWLTALGLIAHLLDKMIDAKKIPGFSWKIFWDQNFLVYVVSSILCFIGLVLISSGIEMVPGNTKIVIAFGLGYGGGAMVRSFLKKVSP